jgi:hypothetical protein
MPHVHSRVASLALAAGLGLPAAALGAPIVMNSPTTSWTTVLYSAGGPDWSNDQGTGQDEADIVGNLAHPAFYTAFDDAGASSLTDGMLGFRIRLGEDQNPAGFGKIAAVGIDANLDGALDVYVMVRNSGGPNRIAIFNAGPTANTSPATTSISSTGPTYIQTALNYDWSAVTATIDPSATIYDVDGDTNVDHFLSFAVPLQDLVNQLALLGITGVNQDTPFQYVIGTSTNAGTLNQDISGPNDGTTSTSTWAILGATTLGYSAAGMQVPEPGTAFLMGLGLLGIGIRSRFTRR